MGIRIGIGSLKIGQGSTGVDWSSYWKALKAAMVNKPSAAYELAADTFIRALVDGGVWAKLDRLFVFAAETNDGGEALLDWIHPTGTPAELTYGSGGSVPTFTANEGFTGNNTNKSYIDTKFNPTAAGSKYTLTSASLGVYANKIASGLTGNTIAGANITSRLAPHYSDSNWRGSLNLMNFTAKARSTTPDLSSVMRDGDTILRYKNKTSLGDETAAPSAVPNHTFKVFWDNDATSYDNSEVSMLYVGAGLTPTELGVLVDAWSAFFFDISMYEPDYNILSDSDDLYAHESQILIKQIGGVDHLFLLYISNKSNGKEWAWAARGRLKVFNLSTLENVLSTDLFYGGMTAGLSLPNDKKLNAFRGYFYGDGVLRCFIAHESGNLYTRDLNISDANPANWTAGNMSIIQMTMKNGDGDDVTVDVTSANIQAHLEYTLSESNVLYNGLMPMFRNMDIAKSGDNWYATLELSGELISVASNIVVTLVSSNAGNTWSFGSLVLYATDSRNRLIEPSIFFIGTDLHIIARSTSALIWHIKSEDSGATWAQQTNILLDGISASKPCAINYTDGTVKSVMAITETSKLIGYTGRTTLWIGSMAADGVLTETTEILTPTFAHYPSMCYYGGKLYISYTKALKGTSTAGDRDSIVLAEIV